jgi:hypothetical protein
VTGRHSGYRYPVLDHTARAGKAKILRLSARNKDLIAGIRIFVRGVLVVSGHSLKCGRQQRPPG